MLEPHAEIPCLWIDMAVTIGTSITLSWVYTEVTAVTSGEDVDPRSVVPQSVGADTGLRSSRTRSKNLGSGDSVASVEIQDFLVIRAHGRMTDE